MDSSSTVQAQPQATQASSDGMLGANPGGTNIGGTHIGGTNIVGDYPQGTNPVGVNPTGCHPGGTNIEGDYPEGKYPEGVLPQGSHPATQLKGPGPFLRVDGQITWDPTDPCINEKNPHPPDPSHHNPILANLRFAVYQRF